MPVVKLVELGSDILFRRSNRKDDGVHIIRSCVTVECLAAEMDALAMLSDKASMSLIRMLGGVSWPTATGKSAEA